VDPLKGIGAAVAILIGLTINVLLTIGLAVGILKVVDRLRKPKPGPPPIPGPINEERGSLAWLRQSADRRFRMYAAMLACFILYLLFAVFLSVRTDESGVLCVMIGFGIPIFGTITAGIAYGTDDRDYYF
jgi:hypothetical protein